LRAYAVGERLRKERLGVCGVLAGAKLFARVLFVQRGVVYGLLFEFGQLCHGERGGVRYQRRRV
jgi:hypothetical protein